jgi:hypothetical protein
MFPCPQFVTRRSGAGESLEIGSERVENCGSAIPLEKESPKRVTALLCSGVAVNCSLLYSSAAHLNDSVVRGYRMTPEGAAA